MNDDDNYEDFLNQIRKMFNLDLDAFDVDFLIMPESSLNPNLPSKDKNKKGIKVTYHFEPGMERPEIKVEGDFDAEKFRKYLADLNLQNMPQIKRYSSKKKENVIDAKDLLMDQCLDVDAACIIEPRSDVSMENGHIKIVIEAPGIEKGHALLSLDNKGRTLKFSAESNIRKYEKFIELPSKSMIEDYKLSVNNGIVTILLKRT